MEVTKIGGHRLPAFLAICFCCADGLTPADAYFEISAVGWAY